MKTAIFTGLMLAVGDLSYQFFGAQDWETGFERAWFQFTACIALGLVLKFRDGHNARLTGGRAVSPVPVEAKVSGNNDEASNGV